MLNKILEKPDVQQTLLGHLMRRAGFGSVNDELEVLSEKPYEKVVNELLNPQGKSVDIYELL